jgi:carboxymethylenebutenolidase
MPGETVTYPSNGADLSGYLSAPRGSGPGVIVIQEWWGLVRHIKNVADRFAQEGFVALAPDLYRGKSTRSPDEAGKLMMAINIEQAGRDIAGAVSYLESNVRCTGKIATVGFCMGGALSLYAASRIPEIAACVVFYGIHPNARPDLPALKAPVLGLYAEKDAFVTPENVRTLDQQLTELGKPHEFHTYPNTDHAFFNDERPEVYDQAAAADAWNRTLQFLRTNLR